MAKVIGLQSSTGEYNGKQYDNVKVHCTYEAKNVEGLGTVVHKVKKTVFVESPCDIGDDIDVLYNRYGGVEQIRVL